MKLSVVIPVHNAGTTLKYTIEAILHSTQKIDEIIVVDDHSTDNSLKIAKRFPVKAIELKNKTGAGAARNAGARRAKGEYIVFIDSDLYVKKDAIKNLIDTLILNNNVSCVVGLYSEIPFNKSISAKVQALKDHYDEYYANEKWSYVSATICGMKRDLFLSFAGFKEYSKAGGEEFELGKRFNERGLIIRSNPRVEGHHYYPNLRSRLGKYFRRTIIWLDIWLKYKKFESAIATPSAAMRVLFVLLAIIFFSIKLFLYGFLILAFILLAEHRYYLYVLRKSNLGILLLAVIYNYLIYLTVGLAAIFYFASLPPRKVFYILKP